jgi:hypothetical protein
MATAASTEPQYVILRGGVSASLDALRVGWSLEARGFTLRPVGDKLQVQPHDRLQPEDVAAIRRHRDELLALARYDVDALDSGAKVSA